MQHRMKNKFFCFSLCVALITGIVGQVLAASQESGLAISVEARQRPLKEVLTEISKQTSWTIVVDERLIEKPISGSYQDIEFGLFLKRALKGENLIVLYDGTAKRVDIRYFSGAGNSLIITPVPLSEMEDQKKLLALRAEEQRVYDEYISNPDSVDPLTGMKLSEIEAVRATEEKAYQEYLSNPASVDPVTGMKLSEIETLRYKEQKAYDEYISNPDSVDPLTGMTLGEIKALRSGEDQKTSGAESGNQN